MVSSRITSHIHTQPKVKAHTEQAAMLLHVSLQLLPELFSALRHAQAVEVLTLEGVLAEGPEHASDHAAAFAPPGAAADQQAPC